MSYQVLARKWRPRRFADLVGQEHVVQVLRNALSQQRLHHAYLFTGTRGVGKTTLARILAKCLNCEQGITPEPCGDCGACREIDEGRFVDLLEVDAASRTKVDQTRDLLDNVPYAPARGRFKVYLIDEVHMFSNHSFNALLKTLEEPPPHVKFLLATTDPQKVPVTVLSRCLQLGLKQLLPDQIQGQLARILDQEAIPHEPAALNLLARAADGSMRDGLSLLDQAIAFGGGQVREEETRALLGTLEGDLVLNLLEALARGSGADLLDGVAHILERTPDLAGVLEQLLLLLHQIAVGQLVPGRLGQGAALDPRVAALAEGLSAEDVQLFYQIGILGQQDLVLAPDPRAGLEMVLLRMLAFRPGSAGEPRAPTQAPASQPMQPAKPPPVSPSPPSQPMVAARTPAPGPVEGLIQDWHALVKGLALGGMSRQLANNCDLVSQDAGVLCLGLDPAFEGLRTSLTEESLVKALQERLGAELKVQIRVLKPEAETPAQRDLRLRGERQRQAEQALERDPDARALQERFGAELLPGSVKPLDD